MTANPSTLATLRASRETSRIFASTGLSRRAATVKQNTYTKTRKILAGAYLDRSFATSLRFAVPVEPVLVAEFEFVEWTPENHLRHSRFMGLRADQKAIEVVRR